jgi:hypothetical protein
MMPAEIKRPAIAVRGERGRAGDNEATGTAGCVSVGTELAGTVAFSSTIEVRVEFIGDAMVRVLMSEFFMEGLLTVTK